MARKRSEQPDRSELGRRLRDLVLDCRIENNPYHDQPGWDQLPGYSRRVWTLVAQALIAAGWRPPMEER